MAGTKSLLEHRYPGRHGDRKNCVPIISQLLQHPAFLSEVVSSVRQQLLGALIYHNGVEATVTDYRLTTALEFQPGDCVGNTCTVRFSGMGEATGVGPGTKTNSPETFLTERPLLGYVDVAWPEGTESENSQDFEVLYPSMTLDIRVELAGFTEE